MGQRDLRLVLIGLGAVVVLMVAWMASDALLEGHRAPLPAPASSEPAFDVSVD